MAQKLNCKRCDYTWMYNGKSQWYTSCPRCKTTIRVKIPYRDPTPQEPIKATK